MPIGTPVVGSDADDGDAAHLGKFLQVAPVCRASFVNAAGQRDQDSAAWECGKFLHGVGHCVPKLHAVQARFRVPGLAALEPRIESAIDAELQLDRVGRGVGERLAEHAIEREDGHVILWVERAWCQPGDGRGYLWHGVGIGVGVQQDAEGDGVVSLAANVFRAKLRAGVEADQEARRIDGLERLQVVVEHQDGHLDKVHVDVEGGDGRKLGFGAGRWRGLAVQHGSGQDSQHKSQPH